MRIDISKLKEGETLLLEHDYDPKALNLELYGLRYVALLKLKGKLERIKNSLFFKGLLSSELEILCTRCLKPVNQKVKEAFDLYFPFTGEDFLETTDEIREVMILSYPVKFLCQDSCKGLCPKCGINWNDEKCACKLEDTAGGPNEAFDKLKEWYQNKKEKK